jgi:hypothetical protein
MIRLIYEIKMGFVNDVSFHRGDVKVKWNRAVCESENEEGLGSLSTVL